MRISTMYSAEQEAVAFRKDIYPVGNVEDWMCEIERVMRETLRQIIRDALDDYLEVSESDRGRSEATLAVLAPPKAMGAILAGSSGRCRFSDVLDASSIESVGRETC